MKELLGKNLGMTSVFNAAGEAVPVTVVQAGPCVVVQRKNKEREGYDAIQIGFDEVAEARVVKPLRGHFAKRKTKPFRILREVRIGADEKVEEGASITVDIFKAGEKVHVVGVSKGKGFQGVIKRHGKAGGPASHGSRFHRSTGSIGQRTSPGEVFKNMKLPGHLGARRVTVKNLEVVEVRPSDHLLFLRGAVPGAKNGLIRIRKAGS